MCWVTPLMPHTPVQTIMTPSDCVDLAIIELGTNDASNEDTEQLAQQYTDLIRQVIASAPRYRAVASRPLGHGARNDERRPTRTAGAMGWGYL